MKKYVTVWLCAILMLGIVPMANAETAPSFAIALQYDGARMFSEGLAAVSIDEKWGFIDKTGVKVIEPKYDAAREFREGLAAIYVDGKWGFVDQTGEEVVKPQFYNVRDFSEGLAAVSIGTLLDEKWGFIDKTGQEVIPLEYRGVSSFNEGLAGAIKDRGWGVIDKTGKEVIKNQYGGSIIQYNGTPFFSEGLAAVYIDGKWGFVDKTGNVVIEPKYDAAGAFHEGLAEVFVQERIGGRWGFIDQNGTEVVTPKYLEVGNFNDGRASFMVTGVKFGFVDKTGQEVIEPKYNYSSSHKYMFHEGLAGVRIFGNAGYIDLTGKEVIPLQFEEVGSFSEGLAAVRTNRKWGYIAIPPHIPAPAPVDTAPPAIDAPAEWAKAEVDAAISLKLVPEAMQNGYARNITRADFSKLVVHLLSVKRGKTIDAILAEAGKKIDTAVFDDTTDRTILAANALGIVGGKNKGVFDPNGKITRQEAAVMLTRTAKVLGIDVNSTGSAFADSVQVANWAKEAVAFVSSAQDKTSHAAVMGSTGDNAFSPTASYTRQQAFITVKRLFRAQ